MNKNNSPKPRISATFKVGAISLAFLIIGYEAALFVHRASVLRIQERRDHPDTVYVFAPPEDRTPEKPCPADFEQSVTKAGVRIDSPHPPAVEAVRRNTRRVENFRFDPNTVSVVDLQRLGFSAKQAASIDNYRAKGGRFRRKSDFAKSFVVADSVYRRLEPFIDIPLLDINSADSAAFDALPGVGAWTAAEMVRYRKALGGYSCREQLMDVYRFDRQRYEAIADLITCCPGAVPYELWTLPADSLRRHPCIRSLATARAIVLYRENTDREGWTVDGLRDAGILDSIAAARLSRCTLAVIQ